MDIVEFLLFIPLLIYGLALSSLLGQWKHLVDVENWYWPYLVTVIVFTEVAVWNIYGFLDVFNQRAAHSYISYLADLSAPLLLLLAVNSLVREEADGGGESVGKVRVITAEGFADRIRSTYFFMGCFVALHLLPQFRADDGSLWVRLPAIVILFAIAWSKKTWLVYVLGAVWIFSFASRFMSS